MAKAARHRIRDVSQRLGEVSTRSQQPGFWMNARRAIHWRFAKDVASRFPKLRVNPNNLFIKDGPFYTCAGGASAVDFALALVEEDYGRHVALALARELVVHVKRSGEHEQYSEALKFQIQSSDRFADLPAWIFSHLSDDLSIDALAQRAAMSRRNFTRLFHEVFGKTPAQFVAEARIAEAQQRLLVPRNSIESIASSLGFRSADVFSVAFERFTGIRPRIYRALRRAPKSNNSSANVDPHKSSWARKIDYIARCIKTYRQFAARCNRGKVCLLWRASPAA